MTRGASLRIFEAVEPDCGDAMGFDQTAFFAIVDVSLCQSGQRFTGDGVLLIFVSEPLQGALISSSFLLSFGDRVGERQPLQIGGQISRLVVIVLMEGKQLLVEFNRPQRERIGIFGGRLPLEEFLVGAEDRTVGGNLKPINPARDLFVQRIKTNRLVSNKIKNGRPTMVTFRVAALSQLIIFRNRNLF